MTLAGRPDGLDRLCFPGGVFMDIRKVKKLIELLDESGVAEIEIHEGEESVRISRNMTTANAAAQTPLAHDYNTPPPPPAVPSVATAERVEEKEAEEEIAGDVVKAPMVGIFYEAMAPGKPSFVQLGQTVKKGDVLCIIEAMKIMNQIESEFSGVVSKIMVDNGEPVEYGQPLFVIRE